MVYISHRRKSRKPRRRRKHRKRSKQGNSRRNSRVRVSKTKSRRRSGRRKSKRKSRKRSCVRIRRKSSRRKMSKRRSRRGSRRRSRRRRSKRRRKSRRIRPRTRQPSISLLSKETRLRFNFSSNTSTSSPIRRDKLSVPLVIFGMDGCPGCDTAKNICKKKGIKFSYHLRKDNEETVKKVAPGYKYVPVIVNRFGEFIGGSDKLQEYTKNMPNVN